MKHQAQALGKALDKRKSDLDQGKQRLVIEVKVGHAEPKDDEKDIQDQSLAPDVKDVEPGDEAMNPKLQNPPVDQLTEEDEAAGLGPMNDKPGILPEDAKMDIGALLGRGPQGRGAMSLAERAQTKKDEMKKGKI